MNRAYHHRNQASRRGTCAGTSTLDGTMLYTLAVILIVLWLLGMVSTYTMSGFIHVLLVIAIVMVLVRLISGRRVV
jgi:hypothetical protein